MKAGHAGRLPKEDTSPYFRTAFVQYIKGKVIPVLN
jgi:hypothetical protein